MGGPAFCCHGIIQQGLCGAHPAQPLPHSERPLGPALRVKTAPASQMHTHAHTITHAHTHNLTHTRTPLICSRQLFLQLRAACWTVTLTIADNSHSSKLTRQRHRKKRLPEWERQALALLCSSLAAFTSKGDPWGRVWPATVPEQVPLPKGLPGPQRRPPSGVGALPCPWDSRFPGCHCFCNEDSVAGHASESPGEVERVALWPAAALALAGNARQAAGTELEIPTLLRPSRSRCL